jgi:hypothetical protein
MLYTVLSSEEMATKIYDGTFLDLMMLKGSRLRAQTAYIRYLARFGALFMTINTDRLHHFT